MKRREFIKNTGLAAAGIGLSGMNMPYVFANGAPNQKIVVAVAGVNSRGNFLAKQFAGMPNCEVGYICDVDERAMSKTIDEVAKIQSTKPKAEKDFRKALADKGVDALVIAMPDHWHAPAAIIGCSMGKHVYVEKPFSHNPAEGELLVKAARKFNRIVQMGNQRRSGPGMKQMVADLRAGIIGNVYMAKTFYINGRGPSYYKAGAAVPSWLDYDLWQGPAPRRPYMEGLVHYDWHWLWHWGTGEALNNGTHEVDVARWGLGVEFPIRVSSTGGIYAFKDDWETPDTQLITLEFPDNKLLVWENHSRIGSRMAGTDRDVIFYGDKGTLKSPWGDGYIVYDKEGKVIKERKDEDKSVANTVSSGVVLDHLHITNFLDSIREGTPLNSESEIGRRSTLLVQLGNISWRMKQTLVVDPSNGQILTPGAEKYWSREYEKGWEPVV